MNSMDALTIRQFAKAEPFKPFVIRLFDGQEFTVAKPQDVWVPPSGLNCGVATGRGKARVLAVNWIVSVSYRDAA
jgi:hypothetical protein